MTTKTIDPDQVNVILATDCGSTTTKAILIQKVDGAYRQTHRGEAPTTVEEPFADVTIAVINSVTEVAEPYIRRRAVRHLEKGRIVIFAAGTGNPFFTTDTAAALRALEIRAEAILMAKHGVEGVYDADPTEVPSAQLLSEISHLEAIEKGLRVMDSTALSLCMDNDLPIFVFNMADQKNIDRIVHGERVGTVVRSRPDSEPSAARKELESAGGDPR